MKHLDFEPTPQEIFTAMGMAFMVLSSTLPPALAKQIAQQMDELSDRIAQSGEPRIGTLGKALADSFRVRIEK